MKHRLPFVITLVLTMSLALTACAPAYATQAPVEAPGFAPSMEESRGADLAFDSSGEMADSTAQSEPRLVIRNANLSIVVLDPGGAMEAISSMAEEMGGFVVTSNLYKITSSEGVEIPQADITIRVPVEKLDEAIQTVKAMVEDPAVDILTENVSGQDVTKDYTDTKSRLTNLEAAEIQLQNIMDSATKTEDVLAVYNQLVQIREQIEVLKGQVKYYEESAALSAINISLKAQAAVQPVVIGGWRPVGVARDAVQALINTLQFLGSAIIWVIIYILPVGAILVLVFLLLRFAVRKIFKPKPRKTTPAQPPASNPPARQE